MHPRTHYVRQFRLEINQAWLLTLPPEEDKRNLLWAAKRSVFPLPAQPRPWPLPGSLRRPRASIYPTRTRLPSHAGWLLSLPRIIRPQFTTIRQELLSSKAAISGAGFTGLTWNRVTGRQPVAFITIKIRSMASRNFSILTARRKAPLAGGWEFTHLSV